MNTKLCYHYVDLSFTFSVYVFSTEFANMLAFFFFFRLLFLDSNHVTLTFDL